MKWVPESPNLTRLRGNSISLSFGHLIITPGAGRAKQYHATSPLALTVHVSKSSF